MELFIFLKWPPGIVPPWGSTRIGWQESCFCQIDQRMFWSPGGRDSSEHHLGMKTPWCIYITESVLITGRAVLEVFQGRPKHFRGQTFTKWILVTLACVSCLKKFPIRRNSNWIPSVEYIHLEVIYEYGELLNSTNSDKIRNPLEACLLGLGEVSRMEKPEMKLFLETVPWGLLCWPLGKCHLGSPFYPSQLWLDSCTHLEVQRLPVIGQLAGLSCRPCALILQVGEFFMCYIVTYQVAKNQILHIWRILCRST